MAQKLEVMCRYAGHDGYDGYGNTLFSEKNLKNHQKWCERGITCNRPWNPQRDDLGLYELEERQTLNATLLKTWNKWLRSPYCQCTYSSGHRPITEYCRHCNRPMTIESAKELNRFSAMDSNQSEHIRRMRAGPTWVMVYENTVRAAELALKLLINVTGPAPENELPKYGRHNLQALWNQVPKCAKDRMYLEIHANYHDEHGPHTITATGEIESNPMPIAEQPVFDKFGEEFNQVRYAWDNLSKSGIDKVNELAKSWPDPITLYYLHSATGHVLSVLQKHPWDSEARHPRWDRRVQLLLGLDESTYHTDWPPTYIVEEPFISKAKPRRPTGAKMTDPDGPQPQST